MSLLCYIAVCYLFLSPALCVAEEPDIARPFLRKYCLRCHSEGNSEGEFRLDTLSADFVDLAIAQKWDEVVTRINAGEMPPEDEPQPSTEELERIVGLITKRLNEGEAVRLAKRGPVAHYRLSREEYAHTVYDLLGVHFDVEQPGAFDEDPRWHGFERIGSKLSLSPSHVERYLKAAEEVLDQAFAPIPSPKRVKRNAGRGRERWMKELGVEGEPRDFLLPGGRMGALGARDAGLYRFRIQLSGLKPPEGEAPHVSICRVSHGVKESILERDIDTKEDEPIIIEGETFLHAGSSVVLENSSPGPGDTGAHRKSIFISADDTRYLSPFGLKFIDDDARPIFPLVLVDWVESEGPFISEEDRRKRREFYPHQEGDLAEARECLERFAARAWRRPESDAEIDRYMRIVESEMAEGEKFRAAYTAAMTGVLASKNFFYLEEGSPTEKRDRVNDWELATRLSYFLWSSMPDAELFAAAEAGNLHEEEVLIAQLERMMADPKFQRFGQSFPRQWLQLHKVGMFPPDEKLYPEYDDWLEESMVRETTTFFNEVLANDLSLREFISADWTMLNARLARHYGMQPPKGTGFQRVALAPKHHRGGLLTQASILSLTSDGTRHRPVHRGVWLSEAIFGKTPPPPPPNVEPLATTGANQPKATIRMQLEAHATHATCASCHRNIDPLGLAFDNYDAIGRWRTEERVTGRGENPPVDASGKLPSGEAFSGSDEFKQLLAREHLDDFAEAFVEQLATYALRRVMTVDDADEIKTIAQAAKKDDYRLKTSLQHLVLSDLFQKR